MAQAGLDRRANTCTGALRALCGLAADAGPSTGQESAGHHPLCAGCGHPREVGFSGRERRAEWPFDLDDHSAYHRIKDIEEALKQPGK